ncbi:hypothetical protein ACH4C2_20190 [Streptomyces sp. NPDC018057]|uniref:hypothetical protein n=1 Tax=unclassified Streptomyces TaxID=2593676 RepID=UPI003797A1A4
MRSTYMAVVAAAAAMAPAVLGAAPAAAGEATGTVSAAPDRSPAESPGPRGGQARAHTAPDLTLEGAPEAVQAGGDWADFSVVIDNAHEGDGNWTLDMSLNTDGPRLYGDDLRVQVRVDGVWRDARVISDPGLGNFDLALLESFPVPKGRTTVPVRIRAGADAPLVEFFIGPRLFDGQVQSDPGYWVRSEISAPAEGGGKPGDGEKPGGGEEPGGEGKPGGGEEKPGDGAKPGDQDKPGDQEKPGGGKKPVEQVKPADQETPGGGGAPGSAHTPGDDHVGQDGAGGGGASLAETGGGAASGVLLGAGGASIAVGAALAAVARRRRRRAS